MLCSKCGIDRESYKNRKTCKQCDKQAYQDWKTNNQKRLKGYERKRQRSKSRRSYVSSHRKRKRTDGSDYREREIAINHKYSLKKYGLTPEDYTRLLEKQKGVCAICSRPETAKRSGHVRKLNVDHDHKTNKVRGLLCSSCNVALGKFGDYIEGVERALNYLKRASDCKIEMTCERHLITESPIG